jgi:ATP-binding protein involved in chromosome partitioning
VISASGFPMSIRQIVAVGSGKGGVGKSSVVVGLGRALSARGARVGILDADLYGPDIPLMFGVTRTAPAAHITIWQAPGSRAAKPMPLQVDGLSVMSIQFLMSERQAFATAGSLASMLIAHLCTGIDWGDLDYLLIDLPPGTGDITQAVVQALSISAAIVVVTPQDVAHLDTRKLLDFLAQRRVRVLGGVENMSGVACPHCQHEFPLFQAAPQSRTIWDDGVIRLASLPFDQARFGSAGAGHVAGAQVDGFRALASRLLAELPPAP